MVALLMTPVLGRCVLTWLWAAPTASSSPLSALLLAAAAAPQQPHMLGPSVLGPIVVACIAAVGTVLVAWLNTRPKPSPAAAAPPPPVDEAALTLDGRLLVLETLFASLRAEQRDGLAALTDSVDRLCRRFEDHLDRGTGRVPAQRRPSED